MKAPLLPMLLLAAAAFPGAASAATTVGPDPSGANDAQIQRCGDDEYGCTIVQPGLSVPAGKVITGWRGYFAADTSARLVLLDRQSDGTYAERESSYSGQSEGGVTAFDAEVTVPDGIDAIGVEIYGGGVAAVQVTYEDGAPVTPAPDPDPTPVTPDPGPAVDEPADQFPKGFSIEGRGVLGFDGKSVDVFTRNELDKEIDGKIALKVGGKTYAAKSITNYDYHSSEDFSLPLSGKPLAKLVRRGKLTATVIAKTDGGNFSQTVKIIRGGAAGFDGTYRGPGPLVIVVKRGVIQNVSQSLNLFCARSNRFLMGTMSAVPGFPVLVGNDGSFNGRASRSGDTYHYKGAFTKGGTVKGYLSLFHTEIGLSDGKIYAEDCYQASNFTASR